MARRATVGRTRRPRVALVAVEGEILPAEKKLTTKQLLDDALATIQGRDDQIAAQGRTIAEIQQQLVVAPDVERHHVISWLQKSAADLIPALGQAMVDGQVSGINSQVVTTHIQSLAQAATRISRNEHRPPILDPANQAFDPTRKDGS